MISNLEGKIDGYLLTRKIANFDGYFRALKWNVLHLPEDCMPACLIRSKAEVPPMQTSPLTILLQRSRSFSLPIPFCQFVGVAWHYWFWFNCWTWFGLAWFNWFDVTKTLVPLVALSKFTLFFLVEWMIWVYWLWSFWWTGHYIAGFDSPFGRDLVLILVVVPLVKYCLFYFHWWAWLISWFWFVGVVFL